MPIRLYRCKAGHEKEVAYPFGPYPMSQPCRCGETARSVPARFFGSVPDQATALKARGLVPWEKGMEEDADRARAYKQKATEAKLEQVCADIVRESTDIRPD